MLLKPPLFELKVKIEFYGFIVAPLGDLITAYLLSSGLRLGEPKSEETKD
jgi:hypothetical protein